MHSGKDDIQEYLHAFQRGEEKGFNYFFSTLYPALLYFAFRMTRDRAAAEEIVEDSFIKLWAIHKEFDHPQKIKSWLYTTIRNKSINQLKKGQEQEFAQLQQHSETYVLQTMVYSEFFREIDAAINSLPRECAKVFRMIYIDGKPLKQIAEELELSISTVKTQKARGLSHIREKLMLPSLS